MTPPTVSFIVPGEPVPKERAEPTIRRAAGKLRVSFRQGDRTAEYEACVRMIAQAARPAGWPMRCRYRVDLTICRSEPGDKDNYEKAALDSVNPRRAKYAGKGARKRLVRPAVPGVLWVDDRRVYEGEQKLVDVAAREARLEVRVTALPVPCERKACDAKTLYPDDDGWCQACQPKHRTKRA